jgi:hemerythrin-like metal-binding protein
MFKWDEKYSVGIQSIDNQHKQIFVILDTLYNSLKIGSAEIVLDQIIPELENYTILHFQKEEFFFKRFNYAESEEHIREHEDFKRNIVKIKTEMQLGRISVSFDLMIFLKKWIDNHILVVDKKYIECFRQSGLR